MNEESQQQPPTFRERGKDRRTRNDVAPPPYLTREGLIEVDRRSPFDRRATWLREFFINVSIS